MQAEDKEAVPQIPLTSAVDVYVAAEQPIAAEQVRSCGSNPSGVVQHHGMLCGCECRQFKVVCSMVDCVVGRHSSTLIHDR